MADYRSAIKVDLGGSGAGDVTISGNTPTRLPWSKAHWDLNGDFMDGHFYPPVNGLYFSGSVIQLKSLLNVTQVVVDLYKNGVFYQHLGLGTTLIAGAAMIPGLQTGEDYFDIYVTLLGPLASATVDGSSSWSTFYYTDVDPSEVS